MFGRNEANEREVKGCLVERNHERKTHCTSLQRIALPLLSRQTQAQSLIARHDVPLEIWYGRAQSNFRKG